MNSSQTPTPSSIATPMMDTAQQKTSRWLAMAALVMVGVLYQCLPREIQVGPAWLPLALVSALVVAGWLTHSAALDAWNQRLGNVTLIVLAGFLSASLFQFLSNLDEWRGPRVLLTAAGELWASNILLFASVYWRLDAGGPHVRRRRKQHFEGAAFLFPQMTMPGGQGGWQPHFIDYLFLAFNTSTAFSPTDTPTLTPWAKVAMMVQSLISLGTMVLVVARAVGLFPTGS